MMALLLCVLLWRVMMLCCVMMLVRGERAVIGIFAIFLAKKNGAQLLVRLRLFLPFCFLPPPVIVVLVIGDDVIAVTSIITRSHAQ